MTLVQAYFQSQVRQFGCIVCHLFLHVHSPAEIHHILNGGRRIGEMAVLGLCAPHHRGGFNNDECVSRHPYKSAFTRRYGTEDSLLQRTKELIGVTA